MADIDEESFSRQNSQAQLSRPVPGPSTIVPIDSEVTLSNGVKMPTIGCTFPSFCSTSVALRVSCFIGRLHRFLRRVPLFSRFTLNQPYIRGS